MMLTALEPTRPGKGTLAVLVLWLAAAVIAGYSGLLVTRPEQLPLALFVALLAPLATFTVAYGLSGRFRRFVLGLDLRYLTVLQSWRVLGGSFLVFYAHELLPGLFAYPAGLGDLAVGVTAPFVTLALVAGRLTPRGLILWNALGLLDLVLAVAMGIATSGSALGVFAGAVTSGLMASLPLSLVPTFAVPFFIILHVISILQARRLAQREGMKAPIHVGQRPGGIETMGEPRRTYIPAAGHEGFLPLYDPIVKLLGGDPARRTLLDQAAIRPSHRVLDIGCGTGSLVILIKRLHPDVDIVGFDPDPKALARGRRKAERAAVSIQFDQGFSDELPYPEASFDRVFSSFMFHHLREDEKEKTLREVRRVLKPGGSLHLLDFGGPESSGDGALARWLHSNHRLKDNSEGRILTLMSEAEFADPKTVSHGAMLFGRIAYYRAPVPTSEASAVYQPFSGAPLKGGGRLTTTMP